MLLFIWLLRVCDIKSTGGDVRDACCPSDRRNNEVVPDHNTDVNHHEDIDVAEERARVKAIQNDASLDVSIYSQGSKGCEFEPHQRHCVVSLSKTYYSLLCTGSSQEDPSPHD